MEMAPAGSRRTCGLSSRFPLRVREPLQRSPLLHRGTISSGSSIVLTDPDKLTFPVGLAHLNDIFLYDYSRLMGQGAGSCCSGDFDVPRVPAIHYTGSDVWISKG